MTKKTGDKQENTGKAKPKPNSKPKQKTGKGKATGSKATQFKKGKSGNPNGRPKGPSLTTKLKEALMQFEEKTGKSHEELLVTRLIERAISKGDMKAIEMIWNRLEGKPKQAIDMSVVEADASEYAKKKKQHEEEIDTFVDNWFIEEDEEVFVDDEMVSKKTTKKKVTVKSDDTE